MPSEKVEYALRAAVYGTNRPMATYKLMVPSADCRLSNFIEYVVGCPELDGQPVLFCAILSFIKTMSTHVQH